MNRFSIVTAIIALSAPQAALFAQDNAALKNLEGKKVRLNASIREDVTNGGTIAIRGTVFEVRGDSIHVLQEGGQAAHLPLSGVRTLHVYAGRDHMRGAYMGALAGAGFGLFATFLSPIDCDEDGVGVDCYSDGSKPTLAEYAWSNMSAFALLGSIYGAIRGTDRWDPVLSQPRVTITPARGGGIRVGVRF
jgi:hypothetical protein